MNRTLGRRIRWILAAGGTALLLSLLPAAPALALHDQGNICYNCHSLDPSVLRPGSNSINLTDNILGSIPTKPSRTDRPLPGTGGYPISCDYCHKATSDVPYANFVQKSHKHPVDIISTLDCTTNPQEITCNDCHNGDNNASGTPDLTPASLVSRTATDGYPDHDNVLGGTYDLHTLDVNAPHLTKPYWPTNRSKPGLSGADDSTFWTGVKNNTQDMICWVCHESGRVNTPTSAPFTQVTSSKSIKADYTGAGPAKGHQIQTAVGSLAAGTPLPCYNCHDSHGSGSHALILDASSIEGRSTLAVTNYDCTTARPWSNDRIVCAPCHDTGLATSAAGTRVEGMNPMDPYNSASWSLHRTAGIADVLANSTRNCLGINAGCHANPHNPVGESLGGQNCGACHSGIWNAMDDSGGTTSYHHVMYLDNTVAPAITSGVPTAAQRNCLVCHVDHDRFSKIVNSSFVRARNLRTSVYDNSVSGGYAAVQTDYDNSLTGANQFGGVCTSCHRAVQTKNTTYMKSDGLASTAIVDNTNYGPSIHAYPASGSPITGHFQSDNSTDYFRANCSKCHTDTLGTTFQDNSYATSVFPFSLHDSVTNKLVAPMGNVVADNAQEQACFRCHSHSSDSVGGSVKGTDGLDWYKKAAMDNAAESSFNLFGRTSRHPVKASDQANGKRVDCQNCHNVHRVRSTTQNIAANPDNTYAFAVYNAGGTALADNQNRSAYCLKCHDGSGPAQVVNATSYVPLSVEISAATMNKQPGTGDNTRGHWAVNGSIGNWRINPCDACHDKHGSTYPKLLGVFNPADGANRINGVSVPGSYTAADNATICGACHTAMGLGYPPNSPTLANITATENFRNSTGYFEPPPQNGTRSTVRWPGKATWDNGSTYSPHNTTSKSAPATLNNGSGRQVGDCNSCHDAHGTPYQFNMLNDNMTAANFELCFDCHSAAGTAADNIAGSYPANSGGAGANGSATVNSGHNIKTAGGKLAQYAALPCYDCHVTHGSRNANTQLKSDQRWAGLGDTKLGANADCTVVDNNSRVFCLGCHVTTDLQDGYGRTVAAADNVENLSRTASANRLSLPTTNPIVEHTSGGTYMGCQRCHYGANYNDNTYGPHRPNTGLCDTCHQGQGALSAATASYTGAHRTHVDNTGYKIACKQCHSWSAPTNAAIHRNNTGASTFFAQVAFDCQASTWSTLQYATPASYDYRTLFTNPYGASSVGPTFSAGADNGTADAKQANLHWHNGTCSNVWCHSNANPIAAVNNNVYLGAANSYASVSWVDNSLPVDCTGCHGGDGLSVSPIGDNTKSRNGSVSHLKHVNGGIGCKTCHFLTVTTDNNRQVDNVAGHVNGSKEVSFFTGINLTWSSANKTCNGSSCHGNTLPYADWDNNLTVVGCSPCHQSNGPGNTFTFTGAHQTHTDNATYRTACEACHAYKSGHGNGKHSDGDNNTGTAQYANVVFTDCAAVQVYNTRSYNGSNLWTNPYSGAAVTPSAYVSGAQGAIDTVNSSITWSMGTCTTVWCHSNANPRTATGGVRQNQYRNAVWDCTAQPCTYCHSGKGNSTAMNADNTLLSYAHILHVADNLYNFTCNECHANTIGNDSDTSIIPGTGFDNHLNGVKSVFFGTTLRTTTITQATGAYDCVTTFRCTNLYCHSSGIDNNPTGGFGGTVQSPQWDNVNIAGCSYCHGGFSGVKITTNGHDNHIANTAHNVDMGCVRCHSATVNPDNTIKASGYALHVNGYRNVVFDNGGSYAPGTYPNGTCSATFCHRQGNRSLTAAEDNLSITWDCTVHNNCRTCHGSKPAGANYFTSKVGEPNYDNGFNGGALARNSHEAHMKNATSTVFCAKCHGSTVDNNADNLLKAGVASHLNDNVEVVAGSNASFSWDNTQHRCSNISCHGGTGTQAVWGESLGCKGCHTSMGIDNAQYTPVHQTHTDNTTYKTACEACHANKSNHGNVAHGNGDNNTAANQYVYADVVFSDNALQQSYNSKSYYGANLWTNPYTGGAVTPTSYVGATSLAGTDPAASSITYSAGTCNNIWCHSNANPRTATGGVRQNQYRSATWSGSQPCTYCHTGKGTAAAMNTDNTYLSYAHIVHAASDLYSFTCSECHARTVGDDSDSVIIPGTGYDNHLNGIKTVYFGTTLRTTAMSQSTGSYDNSSTLKCTNLYCHSNGTDNDAAGGYAGTIASPAWNNVAIAGCTYCHGGPAALANPMATGAHGKHIASYKCATCHGATLSAGTDNTIAAGGYSKHVNGYKDVVASGVSFTYVDNLSGGFGSCNTISCHNNNNANWADTGYTCDKCHAGSGDQDDYDFGNGTTARIDNAQYNNFGHNKAGVAKACSACHSGAIAHDNASNLYRLGAGFSGNNYDTFCSNTAVGCHVGSSFKTGSRTDNIGNHTAAVMIAAGANPRYDTISVGTWDKFTPKCIDCHDPHGDGSNLHMIQSQAADNGSWDNLMRKGNSRGANPLTFTNDSAGQVTTPQSTYADNAAGYSSLCQACHSQGYAFKDNINANAPTHTGATGNPGDCITCHKHGEGFRGSGCAGCHGNGTTNFWPDNAAVNAEYADRAGAHVKHVAAIGNGNSSCVYCHPGNPPTGHYTDAASGDNLAEVSRMSTNADNTPDFWASNYMLNMAGQNDLNGVYRTQDVRCVNVTCHGGVGSTTPRWYPDTKAPVWSLGNWVQAVDCTVGGTVRVSWRRAIDNTTPVYYDLYRGTTTNANTTLGSTPIYVNLTDNVIDVSGLTDGTTYYFGVRAKDSANPQNVTTDNVQSAGVIPTRVGGGGTVCPAPPAGTTFYVRNLAVGTEIDGAYYPTTTSGTVVWNSTTTAGFARQMLSTTSSSVTASFTVTKNTSATFDNIARFYLPTNTADNCFGPNTTSGYVSYRPYNNADAIRVQLISHNPSGSARNGTVIAESADITGTSGAVRDLPFSLTFPQTKVPSGQRLALQIVAKAAATTSFRFYYQGSTTTGTRILFQTPVVAAQALVDNLPPDWSGGSSGITATDAKTEVGGTVDLTWNTAVDAFPSNPVKYALYRNTNLGSLWSAPYKDNLTITSFRDTGLANGVPVYYGVRAKDNWTTPRVTTNIDNVVVTPTVGGSGSFNCSSCHGFPPHIDTRDKGSHMPHTGGTPEATACDICHPGASSYTNAHQDGKGQLGFAGVAYDNIRSGNINRYNNGTADFYYDADGYGYLTGTAGDGTSDGTCSNTGAGCHAANTPVWGNTGGTPVTCFSCHSPSGEVGNKPLEPVGNGANPVDNVQYRDRGHGRTLALGNYVGTGNPPAQFDNVSNDCYYCHSQTAPHATKSAADPYRLGFGTNTAGQVGSDALDGAYAENVDALCLKCHGDAAQTAGVAEKATTVIDVKSHTMAVAGVRIIPWVIQTWKCVDCHDPHGDNNIAMIRRSINAPTTSTDNNVTTGAGSNKYGTPLRATFTDVAFSNETGYAAGSFAINGGDGICEICHIRTLFFKRGGGAGDNIAGGTHATRTGNCVTCHGHAVGFKGAGHQPGGACKGCHQDPQTGVRDIYPATSGDDYNSTSTHGAAWATIADADCEKCHSETSSDHLVVLKVWNADNTTFTTVTYDNANLGSANTSCLSCHDANGGPAIGGVLPTTQGSVGQFLNTTSYNSHKYTPTADVAAGTAATVYNTTPVIVKARSPHGKPSTNVMKGGTGTGDVQAAFTDASPVGCLNCHPSHGSNVTSPTYSESKTATGNAGWATAKGGRRIGGNPVKLAGIGRNYTGEGTNSGDTFCWSCHDNIGVDDFRGDSNAETVSAGNAPTHWSGTWTRPSGKFSYKTAAFQSSHFNPNETNGAWTAGTPAGTRIASMQCTSCHDPHGGTLDNAYYAWALKGGWMTSPYKEDRVPDNASTSVAYVVPSGFAAAYKTNSGNDGIFDAGPRTQPNKNYNNPPDIGNGYLNSKTGYTGTALVGTGSDGYFIDDNSFGVDGANNAAGNPDTHGDAKWPGLLLNTNPLGTTVNHRNRISETADQFGGLCAKCHADSATQTGAQMITTLETEWSGHRSVKNSAVTVGLNNILTSGLSAHMHAVDANATSNNGETDVSLINESGTAGRNSGGGYGWATAAASQYSAPTYISKYHEFPCSKCHTPHASRLKRLMVTNCLDIGWQSATQRSNYPKHRRTGTWTYGASTMWGDPTDGTNAGTEDWHYATAAATSTRAQTGRPIHCHNLAATNTGTSGQAPSAVTGAGWNAVTGW